MRSRHQSCVDVEACLRRQAGVISRAQARDAGLSQDAIDRRLATGRWERLHPGVFLAGAHPYSDEARFRAAALWAGVDAAPHAVSAAWWHGLGPPLPTAVDVTVPVARRPRPQPGVVVRRRDLLSADLVHVRGLWVTDVALTVLEAAVALGRDGPPLLDRALQRWVGFAAVYRAHCRNLGRVGSAAASRLLVVAADRAASHAERLFVKLLREAGIGGWRLGYRYEGYVIDVAFVVPRVAVEIDGWAWHMTPERFIRDKRRQNAVVNGRWHVLRFSWHDLDGRPDEVIADVRAALALHSH